MKELRPPEVETIRRALDEGTAIGVEPPCRSVVCCHYVPNPAGFDAREERVEVTLYSFVKHNGLGTPARAIAGLCSCGKVYAIVERGSR